MLEDDVGAQAVGPLVHAHVHGECLVVGLDAGDLSAGAAQQVNLVRLCLEVAGYGAEQRPVFVPALEFLVALDAVDGDVDFLGLDLLCCHRVLPPF